MHLVLADVCALPAVQGSGTENQKRWYYDGTSNQCELFDYGGFLGNENNFKTQDECEAKCKSDIETKTTEAEKEVGSSMY